MLIRELLAQQLRDAADHNSDVEAKPVCILWPDRVREWETVVPLLQSEMPELFILGNYEPTLRKGPAEWLRLVVGGKAPGIDKLLGRTPILYLPGIGRHDLRTIDDAPPQVQSIVELQYRGAFWSQISHKDWTVLAFLTAKKGRLKIDSPTDGETVSAMKRAITRLLDESVESIKGKQLNKSHFNNLFTSGDARRDLLLWIDNAVLFKQDKNSDEWNVFVDICKSEFNFNPDTEGALNGALKLAMREGVFKLVWERFCESPNRYKNIPEQIRKCAMPPPSLFSDESTHGGWPQWNELRENQLREKLISLNTHPPHTARKEIIQLEQHQAARRNLVWSELGDSSLANALKHLTVLANTTTASLASGSHDDMVAAYSASGWYADDAALRALACVSNQEDIDAVKIAIRSVYLQWLEDSAKHLQSITSQVGYPPPIRRNQYEQGECVLFVDGLRYDAAQRLLSMVEERGCKVDTQNVWAALPSITPTGKPSVTPVADKIIGHETNSDFTPCVASTNKSLQGGHHLKKLLEESGWQILERTSTGDPNLGNAWCEFGDIDSEGHVKGFKLANEIDNLLIEIRDRIIQLLNSGWKIVRIVTDHGWLLVPGGLPKVDLHASLTENKWGRCAAIKPGASINQRMYPWFWNPTQQFALADGIACFRKGVEYTHGGLSLQECLNLEMKISRTSSRRPSSNIKITDIGWKGLRCTVAINHEANDLSLDIRVHPGDPDSSLVVALKPLNEHGKASVIVEDEESENTDAVIVIIDSSGDIVAQADTIIGVKK